MKKILLYINTIRYLKPVQVYWRIFWELKRRFTRISGINITSLSAKRLKSQLIQKVPSEITFNFFNSIASYRSTEIKWIDHLHEKLWRYKLNYFDFLFSEPFVNDEIISSFLILDWIANNSDQSAESWEPYVISKRIITWLKWLECAKVTNEFRYIVINSIIQQLFRLSKDIEWHIQANHLFENLKAIFLATSQLIEFEETPLVLRPKISVLNSLSLRHLTREIPNQVFTDGGHYERCPSYHYEVMNGIKEIIAQINKNSHKHIDECHKLFEVCLNTYNKMVAWDSLLRHPDGFHAQFGDTVLEKKMVQNESYVLNSELEAGKYLGDSKFFVKRWGSGNYFVISLGEPSPFFQPGHSHCDLTSYELSINGNRIITDTGCGSYQNLSIRFECRRTMAHNVPWVNPIEQSEIWGSFRIARRVKVLKCEIASDKSFISINFCDYLGNVFQRSIFLSEFYIEIVDKLIKQSYNGNFESYIHFCPGVQIEPRGENQYYIISNGGILSLLLRARGILEEGKQYPRFGEMLNCARLRLLSLSQNQISYSIILKNA